MAPYIYTTDELLKIAQDIERLGVQLKARLDTMDPEALVMFGHKLWLLSRKATAAWDILKEALREAGVDLAKGVPGPQVIEARDGSQCTVILPEPRLLLRKGADIDALKALLGDDFDAMFEQTTTHKPRGDLRGKVASLADAAKTQAILEAMVMSDGTAKVYFKE